MRLAVLIVYSFLTFGFAVRSGVDGKRPRPYYDHPTCPRQPNLVPSNRTCMKKCLRHEDCRGTRRRCLCDGPCGKSCIRSGMKCRSLDDVMNGRYEITSQNSFGAVVRYSCDHGYVLSGQMERSCQGDGRWSGRAPTCETEGKCANPPIEEHAEPDLPTEQMTFALGTQLSYTCKAGYQAAGLRKKMCVGEGRWVGPKITCSPRSCGHPGEIPNGRKDGQVFVYESRVNYTCIPGYELVGRPYRVCQADGTWSGSLPTCRPKKCLIPRPLANGFTTGSDFSYGALIHHRCQRGFKLVGPETRKCRQDQTWSDENPVCALVDCGHMGELYGGRITYTASTAFNSIAIFRCIQETKPGIGEEMSSTCLETGQWSNPLPNCWRKCKKPKAAKNSYMRPNFEGRDEWIEHGKTLPVNCSARFVKEADPVCHNGTWSHVPQCLPSTRSCSSSRPTELKDGFFRFFSANHDDRAQYMCDSGFQLIGNPFLVCVDGEWRPEGESPHCNRTECEYPGTIDNGEILLVGVIGKFIYRPYVRKIFHNEKIEYSCYKYYTLVGPHGATCVNGSWSPPNKPACYPKQHLQIEPDRLLIRGRRSKQLENKQPTPTTREQSVERDDCCLVPLVLNGAILGHSQNDCLKQGTSLIVICSDGHPVSMSLPADCNDTQWTRSICAEEKVVHTS